MAFGYPKLKYPLDRRNLNEEQGLILLAYDCVYRLLDAVEVHKTDLDGPARQTLINDAGANMIGLGSYIMEKIGKERFEEEKD
jgi:hypothetical protein